MFWIQNFEPDSSSHLNNVHSESEVPQKHQKRIRRHNVPLRIETLWDTVDSASLTHCYLPNNDQNCSFYDFTYKMTIHAQMTIVVACWFLAVQNSSIGDLVTHSVTHSVTQSVSHVYFCHTKSNPKDLLPLRHLIRMLRRHDLTDWVSDWVSDKVTYWAVLDS